MKYVLLLLGIVLVLVGGASIYSGYGIIEDERGWATFIAGATALTGGVIVIALAWILRSLEGLRSVLDSAAPRGERTTEAVPERVAPAKLPLATVPASLNPVTQPREKPPSRSDAEPEIAKAAIARPDPAPKNLKAPPAPPVVRETANPSKPLLSRAASAFVTAAAKAERRTEPSVGELWRRVGVDLDAPKSGIPQGQESPQPETSPPLPRTEAPESGAPAANTSDWLDAALAGFEKAMHPETDETAEEPPPLAPDAPAEAAAAPEVIGRYEAEGTSYVMYSDGSIEAHSAEGVIRFNSMAELQAFFQR